jgi:glycosyltransferase involved in cell wall biosynthesis|tara:strand:+ start:84 stop:779 length:696 start_codon:yes stop_codon:yes gene_type:complete
METLTVLCSNYNSDRWIDNYLLSLNNQLLKEFTIIFVDANSTDHSLKTIKNYKFREGITKKIIENDKRITIYEAWNMAIEASKSEFVINFNTDDRLFPGALLTLYHYMVQNPNVDIAYGTSLIVGDEDHNNIRGIQNWPEHSHEILLQNCICGPFPIVKKSVLVNNGLFNPKYTISGDYEMWLRLSKRNYKFKKIIDFLGSYYDNPKGVSSDKSTLQEHIKQDTEIRNLHR